MQPVPFINRASRTRACPGNATKAAPSSRSSSRGRVKVSNHEKRSVSLPSRDSLTDIRVKCRESPKTPKGIHTSVRDGGCHGDDGDDDDGEPKEEEEEEEEVETPRCLKRKRAESPSVVITPLTWSPSTPVMNLKSNWTKNSTVSPIEAGKCRTWLDSPVSDDQLTCFPSKIKRIKGSPDLQDTSDCKNTDTQFLVAELAALRADLFSERKVLHEIKRQAARDNSDIVSLRADFESLRSQLTAEEESKVHFSSFQDELLALRADLEVLRCGSSNENSAPTSPDDAEKPITDQAKIDEIIHLNELLRRVLQGERIYTEQMHKKLHSLRKKVGPLLAKVDTLQGSLDEIKTQYGAHDAPIELIMDFVRMFHSWWVDRYNMRQGSRNGQVVEKEKEKGKGKVSQGGGG
ncbi:Uncharacterized protein PECH_006287 [Penicillium ucsense]|uniref:Uncharacterized protein n=1 Tax=Penicillium ucsense TaxID=2839758 RepID=A0A8J8W8P2_9EURO|nr:Uncharacterized protein PECM_000331 [Penicillium ucsense]KAF7739087.1 Uncharacterized protein PECH_006287 [Penicillium ucsense]